ncbi:MAG: bifunctional homocysteine S-methyltransferase/methylenetetrahydrofolate reductase, partial [Chloroflexi bacterium]|nr:bifunctional homocysteine S-methyltransferase/methylenetetrahydrofolate reductase [Chloroflexota bacterium]
MNQYDAFRERLKRGAILADGAMGTMLHDQGNPIDACFDSFTVMKPAVVFDVHRAYVQAGAEIIETNTFGANRFRLADHGLSDQVAEFNAAGVKLVQQAIESAFKEQVFVAGAVGPLGVRLAPYGRVRAEQAYEAFHEQITALIAAGVDLLMMETFSDLHELREAIQAARDTSTEVPIVTQLTFTRDDRTLLGDTPEQVAAFLAEQAVDVIGINCSNGPSQICLLYTS